MSVIETPVPESLPHSGFVILSSFDIRASSFIDERRARTATLQSTNHDRLVSSAQFLAQNHFAAFTGSFHRYRFAHLRNLHPGLVHDLVHHFVVVIRIVMEQQEPFCVGVGRE